VFTDKSLKKVIKSSQILLPQCAETEGKNWSLPMLQA